MITSD